MCPYQSHIGRMSSAIVFGDILLHSKSKAILMSKLNGTRTLADILTPHCVFDNIEVEHSLHIEQCNRVVD